MAPIDFLGTSPSILVIDLDGRVSAGRRVYLDSAATCLMPREVFNELKRYLETDCSNSHTNGSASGRATTAALKRAHELVGELVGYDPTEQAVVFHGNGATGPLNLAARVLFPSGATKSIAIVSSMEHHSNMLPWTRACGVENIRFVRCFDDGRLDMDHLQSLLIADAGRIGVVAVSALSNVTGVGADVDWVTELAHAAGARVVIDASQAAAHTPIRIGDVDFLALSGHKIYAPGSPGVLIAKRSALASGRWRCGDVGGGIVVNVDLNDVQLLTDVGSVFEAGTPNIPGAITLGASVKMLLRLGMTNVRSHELELVRLAMSELATISDVVVYGPADPEVRTGIISFNVRDVPHGLVAAALNDFWGIAVRNDCFCAQPYVRGLLDAECNQNGFCAPIREKRRGMVRASFGLFTTPADVRWLIQALKWLVVNRVRVAGQYEQDAAGEFTHKTFRPKPAFEL